MLKRIRYKGVELPLIYMATNEVDCQLARENGLPYIRCRNIGIENLVKEILAHWVKHKFFHINVKEPTNYCIFSQVNLPTRIHDGKATFDPSDFSLDPLRHEGYNLAAGDCTPDKSRVYQQVDLKHWILNSKIAVDPKVLEELELLPKFIGDIADNIRGNLIGNRWTEGYNKKRGYPAGNMRSTSEKPNLMLIDISSSIPVGISSTMIALADTLRTQCNAELIIHSDIAKWYDLKEALPDPDSIRQEFGCCNASEPFLRVLKEKIAGRKFGNVIAFGDYDALSFDLCGDRWLETISVEQLYNYFVPKYGYGKRCGYANWIKPEKNEEVNHDWVKAVR